MLFGGGLRDIAGQRVVESRDVGRALDGAVAAQSHDPAAGASHVAEQELEDARGADNLHAGGVLSPADRVAERRRLVRPAGGDQHIRDRLDLLRGAAADFCGHLERVALEMALHDVHRAVRVLKGRVAVGLAFVVAFAVGHGDERVLRLVVGARSAHDRVAVDALACAGVLLAALARALRLGAGFLLLGFFFVLLVLADRAFVAPVAGCAVILAGLLVKAGEHAAHLVGVAVLGVDDKGGVGVGHHVLLEP